MISKVYKGEMRNNKGVGKKMQEPVKKIQPPVSDDDLGFILWKAQTIHDFLPCIKTIMRQDEETH